MMGCLLVIVTKIARGGRGRQVNWERSFFMATSQNNPPRKPCFIGFAFHFSSPELKFDFFGSPYEIVQQMKQANIDPMYAANHPAVEIRANLVHKDGRIGKFSGGPNAPGLMQLLDTTGEKKWDAARQVLDEYPTLLTNRDKTASVPLCINAALGQLETVEFLIANGAPVNGAGDLGMAPLHWAAVHNQPAIAKVLMDAGADRSLQNWFFLTPANLAHANCHIEVLQLLAPGNTDASKVRTEEILHAMGCLPNE